MDMHSEENWENWKKAGTNISQLKIADNIITDKTKIATKMNAFFCKILETLISKITTSTNRNLQLPESNLKTICMNPPTKVKLYNLQLTQP